MWLIRFFNKLFDRRFDLCVETSLNKNDLGFYCNRVVKVYGFCLGYRL